VSATRDRLADLLAAYDQGSGFRVERRSDGTVLSGYRSCQATSNILRCRTCCERSAKSGCRWASSARELLPAEDCVDDLRALLAELHLIERGHVEVYSVLSATSAG
jgi:hypothetical protein